MSGYAFHPEASVDLDEILDHVSSLQFFEATSDLASPPGTVNLWERYKSFKLEPWPQLESLRCPY